GSYSNECGGGGSGYALNKDSYKPPGYIPTSEYYLENIVMTTGISGIEIDMIKKAQELINNIVVEPEVGKTYKGKVSRIMNFGAF
ncbi:glycine-rich protein, partial [Clostridioides difficile]